MKINNTKTINGWAIYDWANSVYFLVISTAIFPAYYIAITADTYSIAGFDITNSSMYSYAVSFSYLIIVLLAPVLSGIADYGGKRMLFLKFFTYLGAISCIALFFFEDEGDQWFGLAAFMLATIGAAGGLVFYNAYLPEIVSPDKYDRVSARGYAFGYVGSVLLLILILYMSLSPSVGDFLDLTIHKIDQAFSQIIGWFGDSSVVKIKEHANLPFRFGFLLVGLWWMGFAQITFKRLPADKKGSISINMLKKGNEEILSVLKAVIKNNNLKTFLWAVLFYSAGVQTVIYLASIFAKEELGFETNELIIIILILQLLAIFGAYIFALISKKKGNKLSLIYMVIIWTIITILAYFVMGKIQFYVLAGFVGMVMGGIQSLSRSSYSKLVDEHQGELTSYFSFYDIMIKVSIILGTFSFGLVNQLMGGLRPSVLALSVFFILGLIFLTKVDFKESK